jgi:threonine dehydratase
VACSAGNHGQGVALAARKVGAKCEVFVSSHAVPAKVDAMRSLGASIRFVDGDYATVEKSTIEHASDSGQVYISPYNDAQIIAGQGTIGLELIDETEQLNEIRSIVVPIGGGGLISGIGAAIAGLHKHPKLIGVQSTASPFFYSLFHSKTQEGVKELDSIADGLAGEVDHQSLTIPLVNALVDDILLVTEDQICEAIGFAWINYHHVIEGSAAVTLAAVLAGKISNLPAVLIISGGNIQPQKHRDLINKYQTYSRN